MGPSVLINGRWYETRLRLWFMSSTETVHTAATVPLILELSPNLGDGMKDQAAA